jgi:hypothetical protein
MRCLLHETLARRRQALAEACAELQDFTGLLTHAAVPNR